MIPEIVMWLERLVSLLPTIIRLWDASRAGDTRAELEASLALVREIKDRQAWEDIGRP